MLSDIGLSAAFASSPTPDSWEFHAKKPDMALRPSCCRHASDQLRRRKPILLTSIIMLALLLRSAATLTWAQYTEPTVLDLLLRHLTLRTYSGLESSACGALHEFDEVIMSAQCV